MTGTTNDKAIVVEGLVRRFGSIVAVNDISFSVDKGTIFGFLGPNGAGKTTTINILCTLLNPSEGRASINGHDCATDPSNVRKSIGLVFQDTTLDKDLTARENLTFHAYLYSVPRREIKARVDEALNFVNLHDRADDIVKKFSGGMKRRLEVARGLIHRPSVLFLDEPTLGLDPQSRASLWEFITRLPREHDVTVFMTTHYMEEAEVCDKLAIIDNGRIIAKGSPEELKKTVGGDIIALKTTDNASAAVMLTENIGLRCEERSGELYIKTDRGEACIPEIIRTLADKVISVRLQRPTINDVFLEMTGHEIRDENGDSKSHARSEVRAYRRKHGK